jgi:lipoprotein-releasing system permease protein
VYKLLLCLRYLRTRYLAFICIVSVMLGVATLIVVNAVMSGFSTKLKDRLHGVLSDMVVDTDRTNGFEVVREARRPLTADEQKQYPVVPGQRRAFPLGSRLTPHAREEHYADGDEHVTVRTLTPDGIMHEIAGGPAGQYIEAITPTIDTFAVLQYRDRGAVVAKPVRLVGVEPTGRASVGGFAEYLVRQKDAPHPSFDLTPEAVRRHEWNLLQHAHENGPNPPPLAKPPVPDSLAPPPPNMKLDVGIERPKLTGAILGYGLGHVRYKDPDGQLLEEQVLRPGDNVVLTTAGGDDLKPVWGTFIVTDYLKTEMSEYDQSFVYVPLDQLQKIRGMVGRATAFQLKLKNYDRDKEAVAKELRKVFPTREVMIRTWEDLQGPLLSAIDVERSILNILLFMIVGVAGFSILAIFTMIVSEKYRDIGIMKSLGASSWGVMQIFVGYGLLLGTVGAGLGTALGLWITRNINAIEAFISRQTGTAVFPRDIYYFKEIPTNVDPLTVVGVTAGAVLIAVMFSLLPAWRAARLHPVRALRFE